MSAKTEAFKAEHVPWGVGRAAARNAGHLTDTLARRTYGETAQPGLRTGTLESPDGRDGRLGAEHAIEE